jgi:hypothetical protein
MKICFQEWKLAGWDVNCGIAFGTGIGISGDSGIRVGSASIAKNCEIVETGEIPTRNIGQRTDPCLRQTPPKLYRLRHSQ